MFLSNNISVFVFKTRNCVTLYGWNFLPYIKQNLFIYINYIHKKVKNTSVREFRNTIPGFVNQQMEKYAHRDNVILGIIIAHYNIVNTRSSNVYCVNINAIATGPTHAWPVQSVTSTSTCDVHAWLVQINNTIENLWFFSFLDFKCLEGSSNYEVIISCPVIFLSTSVRESKRMLKKNRTINTFITSPAFISFFKFVPRVRNKHTITAHNYETVRSTGQFYFLSNHVIAFRPKKWSTQNRKTTKLIKVYHNINTQPKQHPSTFWYRFAVTRFEIPHHFNSTKNWSQVVLCFYFLY